MAQSALPSTDHTTAPPLVIDGEVLPVVDATPKPLQYPPAVLEDGPRVYDVTATRRTCACGKDGTEYSHGGFTCDQVLQIAARVEGGTEQAKREASRRPLLIAAAVVGGLLVVGGAAAAAWLLVSSVVAMVAAVAAWLQAHWAGLVVGVVLLGLFGGGAAKCAGIHCGGCGG